MKEELFKLERICHEFEALEKQLKSKRSKLPQEWFWHESFVRAIRNIHRSISEELKGRNQAEMAN